MEPPDQKRGQENKKDYKEASHRKEIVNVMNVDNRKAKHGKEVEN